MTTFLDPLLSRIGQMRPVHALGRVCEAQADSLWLEGLNRVAALGDAVELSGGTRAEVVRITEGRCQVLPEDRVDGVRVGDRVRHMGPVSIAPGLH